MNPKYAKFFEPIRINKMVLKNRIVLSPMGSGTEDANGNFGARTMDYLEARAKGGASMIITESQYVTTKYDEWMSHMTITDTELQTKCWTELAERVHAHGSKLCIQMSCGLGKNAYILFGDGGDMVSASEIEAVQLPGKMCRPLSVDEIHEIVEAYRRGAERCVRAGVDAIEIHAHQGYLLDDFMTECWNKRTDEYGGSFENRMRFVTEIYNAIRDVAGPNYPIMIRMASTHHFEGGRTVEDTIEIAKYLEKIGMDAINLGYGSYEDLRWVAPHALMGTSCTAEAAAEVKKHLNIPVIVAGGHTIDSAVELLNAGKMDIASFGRQMIADPDFPNKIYRGREQDVRPCLACNQCCRRVATNKPIACAVNTPSAAEARYPMKKTDDPKRVVVIGGGVAGMEAARVAALQGHNVTLYEKSDRLGGLANAAGAPSFKYRLHNFCEWQKRQIEQLGVKVLLNHPIDENSPELEDAYKIIVSLGANPWAPAIEGIDGPNVIDVTVAHEHPELVKGDTVVVAGGGISGCEAAIDFAMDGKRAIIVEMRDRLSPEDWFPQTRLPLMGLIEKYNIEAMVNTKIVRIKEDGVVVELADGTQQEVKADTVISAFGLRPNTDLADRIVMKYSNSAVVAGNGMEEVFGSVRAGFVAGWSVDDDA